MAMSTDKKLYIAIGVLVALGGALFLQNKKEKEEAAGYSLEGRASDLPKLDLSEEKTKGIDKITISQAAGDAGKPPQVPLEKQGDQWTVTDPVKAKANDANIKS